jgi:hypothetical protein
MLVDPVLCHLNHRGSKTVWPEAGTCCRAHEGNATRLDPAENGRGRDAGAGWRIAQGPKRGPCGMVQPRRGSFSRAESNPRPPYTFPSGMKRSWGARTRGSRRFAWQPRARVCIPFRNGSAGWLECAGRSLNVGPFGGVVSGIRDRAPIGSDLCAGTAYLGQGMDSLHEWFGRVVEVYGKVVERGVVSGIRDRAPIGSDLCAGTAYLGQGMHSLQEWFGRVVGVRGRVVERGVVSGIRDRAPIGSDLCTETAYLRRCRLGPHRDSSITIPVCCGDKARTPQGGVPWRDASADDGAQRGHSSPLPRQTAVALSRPRLVK